jgi:hypothetical protein
MTGHIRPKTGRSGPVMEKFIGCPTPYPTTTWFFVVSGAVSLSLSKGDLCVMLYSQVENTCRKPDTKSKRLAPNGNTRNTPQPHRSLRPRAAVALAVAQARTCPPWRSNLTKHGVRTAGSVILASGKQCCKPEVEKTCAQWVPNVGTYVI